MTAQSFGLGGISGKLPPHWRLSVVEKVEAVVSAFLQRATRPRQSILQKPSRASYEAHLLRRNEVARCGKSTKH